MLETSPVKVLILLVAARVAKCRGFPFLEVSFIVVLQAFIDHKVGQWFPGVIGDLRSWLRRVNKLNIKKL